MPLALLQAPVACHLEAIAFETNDFARWGVRQKHHLAHAEIEQDLSADAIFDEPLLARPARLLFEPGN